jgi:hypothetical protein
MKSYYTIRANGTIEFNPHRTEYEFHKQKKHRKGNTCLALLDAGSLGEFSQIVFVGRSISQ